MAGHVAGMVGKRGRRWMYNIKITLEGIGFEADCFHRNEEFSCGLS